MNTRITAGRWWRLAGTCVLAAVLLLLTGGTTTGLVLHSITIDGDVSDWGDVLTDFENVVSDAGAFSSPVDPDVPGTSDRDMRGVAFTWDSTYLYLFLRRTLGGTNSFEFLSYVDLGHDGRLGTNDVVIDLSYNGSAYGGGTIYRYLPADTVLGDAITGDGVDEPGGVGAALPGTPVGADSPDGIEFEAAIPWTALGVPPGSCMWIHPSISQGTNLPSQVVDNTEPLDTQDTHPSIVADHDGSSASPGQVDYAHSACNEGSCGDVLDLTVRSSGLWRIDVFSDPDGDGDPADGALLGTDGNGDGDFSDASEGDVLQAGADSNGNRLVDTGTLAAGACFDYVVRVHVPAGMAFGTVDEERVRARSATRARELVRCIDVTNAGPITVYADELVAAFAGDTKWIRHVACNNQAFADTLDLAATSGLGWSVEVFSDPNGDGDPSDAVPATTAGPLAPGACAALLVRVTVPAGETPGIVDEVSLVATSRTSSLVTESSLDHVAVVAERFSVTPDHARDTGPGSALFLPHVVTNNQGIPDAFRLSAVSADPAYVITILSDPDGDGEPNDSTAIPDGSVVGPVAADGGEYRLILRVDVPRNAAIGSSNSVVVTARSQADTSRAATATDVVTVSRLLTYSDPLFARPWRTFFTTCSHVYVQAHGLAVNDDYRFIWIDTVGATQRTSPSYQADARSRIDDSLALPCGPPPGDWTIRLQIRSGSRWDDVADGVTTFRTLDPVIEGGNITRLWVDEPIYAKTGDSVGVDSRFENDSVADAVGTAADYVIFQDQDGDGAPTLGEPFILADGTRSTWDPGERTHRTDGIDILSGDVFDDYWHVAGVQFELEGAWCVQARWFQACDSGTCTEVVVDTSLTCFQVTCLPVPMVFAGAAKSGCTAYPVPMSDAVSDGDTFAWSDGGAGGTFVPSATVLNPSWIAPGVGAFVLSLTSTYGSTGCDSLDTVAVKVHPSPVVEAGPSLATCVADGIALSGATSTGNVHSWSDGGAGGTFAPSPSMLNPSYVPPDPSPPSITLSLDSGYAATGCTMTDSLTLVVHPKPAGNAGADKTTCAGDAIALADASATGDAFAWSDGGAGGTFIPSASVPNPAYAPPDPSPAGITLVLASSFAATSCTTYDALALTVNANPVASAGADKTACAGVGVALADAASTGDTFSWSDGGAGGTFTPSAGVLNPEYAPPDPSPASITLTLTSSHAATGCDTVDALALAVSAGPVASAGADKVITCGSPVAVLDGAASGGDGSAGYSYAWSPSAGLSDPAVASPSASTDGTWSLIVTDLATGCASAPDTVTVTRNDAVPVADAGTGGRITCLVTTASLEGSASGGDGSMGYAFAWSPVAGVSDPAARSTSTTVPGTYTLTVTDVATGCTAIDTVVIADGTVPPAVSAGADLAASCEAPGVLQGSASGGDGSLGYVYRWEPAAGVSDPDVAQPVTTTPGTYVLTVTDVATGCTAYDDVTVTHLQVAVPPEPETPPMLVRWVDPLAKTQLVLTWQDVAAFRYAVHAGSVEAVGPPGHGAYDHAPLACALTTAGTAFARPAGNRYFIAVAVNCEGVESSYGRTSLGAERPDAATASGTRCP